MLIYFSGFGSLGPLGVLYIYIFYFIVLLSVTFVKIHSSIMPAENKVVIYIPFSVYISVFVSTVFPGFGAALDEVVLFVPDFTFVPVDLFLESKVK